MFLMCANGKDSDRTAQLSRLIRAIAVSCRHHSPCRGSITLTCCSYDLYLLSVDKYCATFSSSTERTKSMFTSLVVLTDWQREVI